MASYTVPGSGAKNVGFSSRTTVEGSAVVAVPEPGVARNRHTSPFRSLAEAAHSTSSSIGSIWKTIRLGKLPSTEDNCNAGGVTRKVTNASWSTRMISPATASVPARGRGLRFSATSYSTVPLPLPVALEVTVRNPLLLTAVHAQPNGAATCTVPMPPCQGKMSSIESAP